MSNEFDRGYIGMLYLMSKRGEVLRDAAPAECGAEGKAMLDGLCSADRHLRAKWLARALHEIMTGLGRRELN